MRFELIKDFIKSQNLPSYRIVQAREALFTRGITKWEEAQNIPESLRKALEQTGAILSFKEVLVQRSREDLTFKALLRLKDGNLIETVLMRAAKTWSVCLSSQAGCPLRCTFCATGALGFRRNLTAEEIFDQALFWHQFLHKDGVNARISNIVFMGMGEPLLNYQNVVEAVKDLMNPDYLGIGARHISISTAGVADKFFNLAQDLPQVNLALSLHNADDEERSLLMPINKKYNLETLQKKLEEYIARTGREVFIEYTVIKGLNNFPAHVRKLGKWISAIKDNYLIHVNLIACNPTAGKNSADTDEKTVKDFAAALNAMHIPCSIRKSMGSDIAAACGQLAAQKISRGKTLSGNSAPTAGQKTLKLKKNLETLTTGKKETENGKR